MSCVIRGDLWFPEHNAAPARADLKDTYLRRAKELGCKIVVDTDAHTTGELDNRMFSKDGVWKTRS